MAIRIGGDGNANVETRRVVFKVYVQEVGVDGMRYVGGEEEGVCVRSRHETWCCRICEGIYNSFNCAREEVSSCSLPKQRPDFFVIEEPDEFDLTAVARRGVEERLDGRPGTQFIVDASGED